MVSLKQHSIVLEQCCSKVKFLREGPSVALKFLLNLVKG